MHVSGGIVPGFFHLPQRHSSPRTFLQVVEISEYNLYLGLFQKSARKDLFFFFFLRMEGQEMSLILRVSKAEWDKEVRSQICGLKMEIVER